MDPSQGTKILIFSSFTIYLIAFVMSFGPMVGVYIPEIVQPNFAAYSTISKWAGTCFVITLFPIVRSACGTHHCPWSYLFFAICNFMCLLLVNGSMVETKDKTELEIREEFKTKKIFCF